jgi:hypothetical protein
MLAIGDSICVQEVSSAQDLSLVTNEIESAIVREYTFEELLLSRKYHPETLGAFSTLSAEELWNELQKYENFLVEVGDDDYRLVIGFSGQESQPVNGPTILYTVPSEFSIASYPLFREVWGDASVAVN